ncbi:hypothetical protein [Victivallis sp. Marseille-Q1083]|uniref:hypothetical protein n=1 Tax=Victivallis sp. Marseille-Q1083 TaxID=2717288 RepID=UPI00158AE639|nr:hypothetical protein [Victivallis sp. Marseille-Q1083]
MLNFLPDSSGLRCERNLWNSGDIVPGFNYAPSFDKLKSIPFLGPSTLGYDIFGYGSWEFVKSTNEAPGNNHSFFYYEEFFSRPRMVQNVH